MCKKIIDYKVICVDTICESIDDLEKEVKQSIQLGWHPLGGISQVSYKTGNAREGFLWNCKYKQAMVKYEED